MQEPIKASSASTSSATATGIVAPTSPAGVSLPGFKTGGDRDENGDGQFLFRRLAADAVAAASAATLVTPIVTIIDKGIIHNANGSKTLKESMKESLWQMFTKPHKFLVQREFRLIYMLYFGTYISSNFTDTYLSSKRGTDFATMDPGLEKFVVTSSVNMGLCLYKDRCFTQMFASALTSPKPVTLPSYALFATRDLLTVFFSFNVPPLLAPHISSNAYFLPTTYAQIAAPAVCQLFSTPLHLLGLDLYNRSGVTRRERWELVKSKWTISAMARMGRIIPAFGFGGVTNRKVRTTLMGDLEAERRQGRLV